MKKLSFIAAVAYGMCHDQYLFSCRSRRKVADEIIKDIQDNEKPQTNPKTSSLNLKSEAIRFTD